MNDFEIAVNAEIKEAYERLIGLNTATYPDLIAGEEALILLIKASAYFIKHIDEMSPEARITWANMLALYRTSVKV